METKISKTLVDTIIDLQLDDAPLIMKKSALGDKCGSCNQIIVEGSPVQNSIMKYNEIADRYKLKNIHEIATKFGMGSYSKILNNIQTETLLDDLAISNIQNSASSNSKFKKQLILNMNNDSSLMVNLPDIYYKTEKNNNNHFYSNPKTHDANTSVSVDRKLNSLINGELEKKHLKGESLIKSVDKLHELVEPKKDFSSSKVV